MKRFQLTGASVIALCVTAGAALADVTPEQVWEDWQENSRTMGQEVTAGSVTREGDALLVRNVRVLSDEGGTRVEGTYDLMTFREAAGGTVDITGSPDFPMTVTVTPGSDMDDRRPLSMKMNIHGPDAVTRASGDVGDITYAYEASLISMTVSDVKREGEAPMDFRMVADLRGVDGTYSMADDTESSLSMATLDLAMTGGSDGNGPNNGAFNYHLKDVTGSVNGAGMGAIAGGDMAAAVANGARIQAAFAYDSSTYDFRVTDVDGTIEGKGTSGEGSFDFGVTPEGMVSSSDVADSTLVVRGGKIPFPIDLRMGKASSTTTLPVAPSDEPQAFALAMRLSDVTASDAMWNAFDPNRALPRDPAEVALDLSGHGVLPTEENPTPDAPTDLKINELLVRFAGTELTGTGEGTVLSMAPNADPMAPPPVNGTLNLMLKGGNALIDNAIAAGLLPEQQALGARMMLGMFSRPVTGQEDAVQSEIVMRDGQLLVNGQRLQ